MANGPALDVARGEALQALPNILSAIRWVVMTSFDAGDSESDQLRELLEACVVGAHRLNLREQLRAKPPWGE